MTSDILLNHLAGVFTKAAALQGEKANLCFQAMDERGYHQCKANVILLRDIATACSIEAQQAAARMGQQQVRGIDLDPPTASDIEASMDAAAGEPVQDQAIPIRKGMQKRRQQEHSRRQGAATTPARPPQDGDPEPA